MCSNFNHLTQTTHCYLALFIPLANAAFHFNPDDSCSASHFLNGEYQSQVVNHFTPINQNHHTQDQQGNNKIDWSALEDLQNLYADSDAFQRIDPESPPSKRPKTPGYDYPYALSPEGDFQGFLPGTGSTTKMEIFIENEDHDERIQQMHNLHQPYHPSSFQNTKTYQAPSIPDEYQYHGPGHYLHDGPDGFLLSENDYISIPESNLGTTEELLSGVTRNPGLSNPSTKGAEIRKLNLLDQLFEKSKNNPSSSEKEIEEGYPNLSFENTNQMDKPLHQEKTPFLPHPPSVKNTLCFGKLLKQFNQVANAGKEGQINGMGNNHLPFACYSRESAKHPQFTKVDCHEFCTLESSSSSGNYHDPMKKQVQNTRNVLPNADDMDFQDKFQSYDGQLQVKNKQLKQLILETKEWYPKKFNPKNIMDDKFLLKFTEEFSQRIRSLMNMPVGQRCDFFKGKEVPLNITQNFSDPNYSITIRKLSGAASAKTPEYVHHTKETLYRRFSVLIEWILLINTSLLVHLEHGERNNAKEMLHNESITKSIFNESFQPGESRMPLLGEFENRNGELELGLCQLFLLGALSNKLETNNMITSASNIIKLYYETFEPTILNNLKKIGVDSDVVQSLRILTYKAIRSKFKINTGEENVGTELIRYGNFIAVPFIHFPENLQPKTYRSFWNVEFGPVEQGIVKKFDMASLLKSMRPIKKNVENQDGIPIRVVFIKGHPSKNGSPIPTVVITSKGGRIHKSTITSKFYSFIASLRACQFIVEDCFKSDDQSTTHQKELRNNLLFKCVDDLLMPTGGERFPIFGALGSNFLERDFTQNPLSYSDYSDLQNLLIDFFSDSNSSLRILHLVICFVGWWYTDQKVPQFHSKFSNHTVYWDTMTAALQKTFCRGGMFSWARFQNYLVKKLYERKLNRNLPGN